VRARDDPAWRALLQNVEPVPRYQNFSFKPLPRLKAIVWRADEHEGNCDHPAIMF
jgi:hypothetical protein